VVLTQRASGKISVDTAAKRTISIGRFCCDDRRVVLQIMRPSKILGFYCALACLAGLMLSLLTVVLVKHDEIGHSGATILTASWNVLFLMVLPMILDWSERKYFNARFVQLEELAQENPELKAVLEEQCRKLSLPGLRLAAVDTADGESFTYGLWRQNPRLVVPLSWLKTYDQSKILPSIERQLNRFAKRDVSFVFLAFFVVQVALQNLLLHFASM